MPTQLSVSRLDNADVDGAPEATALLVDANRTHPNGRLLGSVVIPPSDVAFDQFAIVVVLGRQTGRVNLVRDGGQLLGVACWIVHRANRLAATAAGLEAAAAIVADVLGRNAPERLGRLDLLDLALEVPDDSTHLHLACLGTVTGRHSHMIADLLLFGQIQVADRDGHTLYVEAHSERDRRWLQVLGFDDCGSLMGDPEDPQSYVLARTPKPRTSGAVPVPP